MKTNYIISVVLLVAVIIGTAVFCDGKEIPITFSWDHNTAVGTWQQVKIFVRINSESYDYDTPIIELPQQYENGESVPIDTSINFNFPDGQKTTAYFVARSYDASGNHSEDSNEVSKTVDLIPLDSFLFQAEYDDAQKAINFQWAVTDLRALRYRIYKASEEDGSYEPIARVDYVEGQTDYSQSIGIEDLFPANERTTVFFKMASWAGEKPEIISSPYTEAVSITIDRRENVIIDKILNFKLILE